MSSRPGLDMESFLLWNYNLVVPDFDEANVSLGIAEFLGNIEPRKRMSKEEFSEIVEAHEPHRERIEYLLFDFDEETQSWRDYAYYAFGWLTEWRPEENA